MVKEKYRDWEILTEMPEGWIVDKTAGAPAPRTVFITNGKNILTGLQKRALLRITPKDKETALIIKTVLTIKTGNVQPKEIPRDKIKSKEHFPSQKVNELARLKFKEQILKEILFDLAVCDIEGWDKKEYIRELQTLLSKIDVTGCKKQESQKRG